MSEYGSVKTYLIFSLVLILAVILSSCSGSQTTVRVNADSPCNDSLFLVLKKKNYESLSGDEKSYFIKLREECRTELKEKGIGSDTDVTGLIIIGTAVILILTYYLVMTSFKVH